MAKPAGNNKKSNNSKAKSTSTRNGQGSKGSSSKSKGSNSKKCQGTQRSSTSGNANRNNRPNTYNGRLKAKDSEVRPEVAREISVIVYLALAIFFVCSNFGLCGVVGRVISGFFFGLFGVITYALPIYLLLFAAFMTANPGNRKVLMKFIWIGLAMVAITFIIQLYSGTQDVTARSLYYDGYDNKKGGGVIFGGLLVLINNLIGKVGATIITILLLIIALVFVAEISIPELVGGAFGGMRRNPEGYDEDDYDDEDEDYYDRRPAKRDIKRDNLLNSVVVMDEEDDAEVILQEDLKDGSKSSNNQKSGKNKKKPSKKNVIVPEEEVHELRPEPAAFQLSDNLYDTTNSTTTASNLNADKANQDKPVVDKKSGYMPQSEEIGIKPFFSKGMSEKKDKPYGDSYNQGITSQGLEPKVKPEVRATAADTIKEDNTSDLFSTAHDAPDGIYSTGNMNDVFTFEEKEAVDDSYQDTFENDSYSNEPYRPSASSKKEAITDTAYSPSVAANGMAAEAPVNKQDKLEATNSVMAEIANGTAEPPKKVYKFPPMSLLQSGRGKGKRNNEQELRETAIKLQKTLQSFGVNVTITDYACGPAVTRYEMTPEVGVKVSKITGLADDIKLNLAAEDIRIEAPIPGKAAVGIEVPNKENQAVFFRDIIDNDEFKNAKSNISFAVGKDISGKVILTDIAKMPHLLIAGSTGSGKSVCINTLIMSILYKAHPDDVKLIMVDPKMVELTAYNGIPHLLIPVVTDAKKASGALNWAVIEMTRRYELFSQCSVRNLEGYNKKVESVQNMPDVDGTQLKKLPQIVVIVDELADLMMVAHGEVEDSIVRLSQLARAAGIHLIIATQRPSVDVITGLIKANVPSRIAFKVSSGVDSRTILDMVGAEKLLGKGDMLFFPTGTTKPTRVQGAFVTDEEVVAITDFIKNQYGDAEYDDSISKSIETVASTQTGSTKDADAGDGSKYDEYFEDAARLVIEKDKASIGNLQRVLRIGFNRAARIMDQLCEAGVVGPEEGTKPRTILMTMSDLDEFLGM